MDISMVNSSSFGSERNGNTKASCMQVHDLHSKSQSTSPLTASSATQSKNEFSENYDGQFCKGFTAEPLPETYLETQKTVNNSLFVTPERLNNMEANQERKSLFCSVPLEKVQQILPKYTTSKIEENKTKPTRKILCLFCERTFVNINLRQKHVERCHSSKQLRRMSLRKQQNFLTSTPCNYCDKFESTEHTLKDLFKHLIENHSNKYFGCLSCEERFLNSSHLLEHKVLHHNFVITNQETPDLNSRSSLKEDPSPAKVQEVPLKITRRRRRTRNENKVLVSNEETNTKNLRSKKLTVKSSRIIIKRSKRLQAKLGETKKKRKDLIDKKNGKQEQPYTKLSEKSTKVQQNHVNPYPEFDHFFQVKKITDHSIDNLKISSLTFDDVFDKAFFNRIKCNIQENLLHHIDGKLFKNEESENRISNFEKISNIPQEVHNVNPENYGCELSLNAIAPTTMLLSNQFGDDPESQIEYGSKPSKKKTQVKKDEVHYKYFTRRKYQASILEHKENRDLSKLDMWTQYIIKNRQQKILNDKKSPKEILDYFSGEEYKSIKRREELNRILDRRGPFEDLKEEASKKAALDKLNGDSNSSEDDNFAEIGEILNDILNKVFELAKESCPSVKRPEVHQHDIPEIPSYLNLRPKTASISENEIDKSDKIALICSSQETENFELPSNTVRGKNEKVELTGEWARSRIYVCAACGLKLQNIKQFLEHKSASHQYIWVQHYEFVGNQSELYRHLSIPVLGKVGVLENVAQCKVWKRSDARLCTKCGKQCNNLGELHRHILECGGDWTWMLARKKCKYRPFGAKSRRKRRGLIKRIYTQKTEPSEKKVYKKSFDIPRQKPSDADTIKRMLANLPPKRATRKVMSLKDGFNMPRTRKVKTTKQTKFKCGKLIHGNTKEQKAAKPEYEKNKNQPNNHRRSLRSLNKVLTSRILDTNPALIVRRKYNRKMNNEKRKKSNHFNKTSDQTEEQQPKKLTRSNSGNVPEEKKTVEEEVKSKRSSPRIEKRLENNGAVENTMNIKRFFPVKKKKKNGENAASTKNGENAASAIKPKSTEEPEENSLKSNEPPKIVNLRKRKLRNTEPVVAEKKKVRTRRLRKKANDVVTPSENCTQPEMNHFFEKVVPKKVPDPPMEEPEPELTVEPSEDLPPPVLTKEEDLEPSNLNSENEVSEKSNENSVPPVITPIVPEKPKRKLRKPARGLNDCIAMLTSKLVQNFDGGTKDIFNDTSIQKEKSEFILKVPMFNEHFDLHSQKEKECLDLRVDKEVKTLPDVNMKNENIEQDFLNGSKCEIVEEKPENLVQSSREEEEEEKEIVESILDTSSQSQKIAPNSDSEDEIPLSTLLKEDCSAESSIFEDIQNLETTRVMSEEINETICEAVESANKTLEQLEENEENKDLGVQDVKDLTMEETEMQEKDTTVLTEINSNLCEQNVSLLDSIENKIRNFENSVLSLEPTDEDKEVDSLLALEEASESNLVSKIGKLNFLINNNIDEVVKENRENIDDDDKINTEENLEVEDESKENSMSLVEDNVVKSKRRKSNKFLCDKSEGEVFSKRKDCASSKKRVRSAKARALESILDEALLELSETEFFTQEKQTESETKVLPSILDETSEEIKSNCATELETENKNEDNEKTETEAARELRRSRRSKKIASYNEVDLVDPLLDDLENNKTISKILRETTKDIFGLKRKNRKLVSKKIPKNGQNEKKLNGDELFDLLKATSNENNVLSKPTDSIFNSFDEISNDFNDDNFDVFEDILEKSIAVIEENLSEPTAPSPVCNSLQDSTDISLKVPSCEPGNKKKVSRKRSKKNKHKNKQDGEQRISPPSASDVENCSTLESTDNDLNSNEVSKGENDKSKNIYCQICNKFFSRIESLNKHKRTLTHISKLSELEAKEAALKASQLDVDKEASNSDKNLFDMENPETEESKLYSSPFINNSNLKLADIINDVLNKPISKKDESSNSFSEIMMSNESEIQPEIRRYKSLAERKSFESENCLLPSDSFVKNIDYFEPEINNEAAGTILEKQITLLENIIENRSSLSYIDELSVSSNENESSSNFPKNQICSESKPETIKPESFLKPTHYEEISEDSNLRNYDEQKARKVLNRDEELFLECCSLLKSGSEVSSYSKKSNTVHKDLNKLGLKQYGDPDWVENNCISQREQDFIECYSDNSRIRTPLGDGFSQEDSNSVTISSHWDRNSSSAQSKKKNCKQEDKKLSFGEMLNNNRDKQVIFRDEKDALRAQQVVSSDDEVSDVFSALTKKRDLETLIESDEKKKEVKDSSAVDGKKMLTKGALKVFEGLKVSIPTEELNIDKILISGQSGTTITSSSDDFTSVSREIKKSTNSNKSNSSFVKSHKTKPKQPSKSSFNLKKQNNMQKIHDVYDFEETQDNSDVFTKPDFRSFRTNYEKSKKTDKQASDDDSQDFIDAVSFDAFSSSTSSVSEQLPTTSKTQQNITKKKCMIMGRIFKNAVKSKDIDEDIRNIPIMDNSKLVEDFVLSCPDPINPTKMTEEERNLAFDNLLNSKYPKQTFKKTSSSTSDKVQHKNGVIRRRIKTKNKKRNHDDSDSSDDEFKLQKSSKKRPKKKCNSSEESCINLEQELKECIGVASRKSQRKCTSGKQNVLIEYWSSDESSFETLLEQQIINSVQNQNNCTESVRKVPQEPELKEVAIFEKPKPVVLSKAPEKTKMVPSTCNRRKRAAVNPLYHWSSSSEDESRDLIEIRPIRDEIDDDEDRPVQHGWIVGDSPKKLVTMLAQAKGKKCEVDSVKEHGKKRTSTFS